MSSRDQQTYLDELIDELNSSDRYIDLDLMADIMEQGEAIVDQLIYVLETDDDWPSVHALLMLIEMRAENALPVISKTLLEDPDLNEWVDTSGLDKFGPVAIDTLEAMVTDRSADWYPRAVAGNALVCIAARHPETYERITAILRNLLPAPDAPLPEDEDPDIWNSIVSDLCQLRDPQAYELIGRLFDAGFVSSFWMSREDYEQQYASADPLYGVDPKPGDLLSSHRAMQQAWARSEKRQSPAKPPRVPSLRGALKQRKQKRKKQKEARRQQRSARKKKKRR